MSELTMTNETQAGRAVLSCRNLGKSYDEGPQAVVVLADLQLELLPGERVAIVGSSGSGKSTLLHVLGGLDRPTEGQVMLNGQRFDTLGEAERGYLRNEHLGGDDFLFNKYKRSRAKTRSKEEEIQNREILLF